jgi:hypothetical protein
MMSHPLGNVFGAMVENEQDQIPDEGFLVTKMPMYFIVSVDKILLCLGVLLWTSIREWTSIWVLHSYSLLVVKCKLYPLVRLQYCYWWKGGWLFGKWYHCVCHSVLFLIAPIVDYNVKEKVRSRFSVSVVSLTSMYIHWFVFFKIDDTYSVSEFHILSSRMYFTDIVYIAFGH